MRNNNWDRLEDLLQLVGGKQDIWYATLIDIAEYCMAGKKLIYNLEETLVRNPTDIDIWICIYPTEQIVKIPAGKTIGLPL